MQRGLCDFLQWWCTSEGHESWTSTPWLQIVLWTRLALLRTSHAAKIIGFPGVLDLGNRFRRINHHSAHGIFFQRGLRHSGHGLKVIDSRNSLRFGGDPLWRSRLKAKTAPWCFLFCPCGPSWLIIPVVYLNCGGTHTKMTQMEVAYHYRTPPSEAAVRA